jgi:hypothetical protein
LIFHLCYNLYANKLNKGHSDKNNSNNILRVCQRIFYLVLVK